MAIISYHSNQIWNNSCINIHFNLYLTNPHLEITQPFLCSLQHLSLPLVDLYCYSNILGCLYLEGEEGVNDATQWQDLAILLQHLPPPL
jgi:hypothetical protein